MDFGFYSSYVALWIWAIFQGLLTLAIFRQVLALEKRSGGWETTTGGESLVGARAPAFSGTDFHSGRSINIKFFDGRAGVILFLSAHCSICRHISRNLRDGLRESLPPIVAICTGDTKETIKLGKRLGPQIPLLLDGADDAASLYNVSSYPIAVVIDAEHRIRAYSGIRSAEDLQPLVARIDAAGNGELAMATAPSRQSA